MITKWRSSYYFRLVLSYTILALVLIGITGGFLLTNANRMVTDEVLKDARFGLINVKDNVENNFLRQYEDAFFSKVLSTVNPQSSETINYLLDQPAEGNISKIVNFVRDIGLITDMTKGLDDSNVFGVTVFFRTGHYAIDQQRYYETPDNSLDASFMRSIESAPSHRWFIREKPGAPGNKVMTYVSTLPYKKDPASASGFLYLDISLSYLNTIVKNTLNFPQSNLYIFNDRGELLLGSEQADAEEMGMVSKLVAGANAAGAESVESTHRYGSNVISILPANESSKQWTYVIVRPMESFLLSADKMKRQVWTASLLALLGGIIASFLLSSHFYTPLKKLLYSIRNLYTGPAPEAKGTEYAAINHMIRYIDMSMLRMRDQVRVKQITGLLTGQQSAAGFGELPAIPLECQYAVVYVTTGPEDNERLQRLILEQSGLVAEIVNLSASDMALLVFIYDNGTEQAIESIEKALLSLSAANDVVSFGAGIGSVVPSVEEIHRSYQEALQALKYSFVRGKNAVIRFDEISRYRDTMLSPDVNYELLQHKIQAGSVADTEHWIDTLAARLHAEPLSIETIELICVRLGTVLSQVVIEQKLHDLFPVFSIRDKINQSTLEETLRIMKEQAVDIARHISESRNDVHLEKISRLKSFIAENMAEDLSLDELATRADLSPNYVSTLFGTITGESFTEYLNRIRLEQAASLLVTRPKMAVAEIATSVGYRNSQYFCTKFKAKFGITPLQYRASEKKGEGAVS
ncbi:MAG: helix-turn-helix domain-containing protein [Paenibacillaceae bacterium]|nr:helix-turn-helix domain-containing protein [Paenibacillaceae bacterium]